jgi:hypothetical protein
MEGYALDCETDVGWLCAVEENCRKQNGGQKGKNVINKQL